MEDLGDSLQLELESGGSSPHASRPEAAHQATFGAWRAPEPPVGGDSLEERATRLEAAARRLDTLAAVLDSGGIPGG